MSNVNQQFLPFRDLDDVQVFRPVIQALFNWHWKRVLENSKSLQQETDAVKFFKFWHKIIEECGITSSIKILCDTADVPIKLISEICLENDPDNIVLPIQEAEKLLIFHHKVCPALQPKDWGYK